jgi:hypothetical protein
VKQSQLGTLLWLRWRLTRNQWRRGGALGGIIAALWALLLVWSVVVGLLGGVAVGLFALHGARPLFVRMTWLGVTAGFILGWIIGVIMDLQRSEIVDLPRLMHLPITLSRAFAVNYVVSLLGFTIAFFLPASLGLAIGLAIDRGPSMLLLAPLSVGLLFMTTSWTYLLQGWIGMWVQSARSRRALVSGLALTVVVLVCVQLGFPIVCFPVYAGPAATLLGHYAHWRHPVVVDFAVSLVMAGAMAIAYAASLAPLGRLLQRRETLILARVTVENE